MRYEPFRVHPISSLIVELLSIRLDRADNGDASPRDRRWGSTLYARTRGDAPLFGSDRIPSLKGAEKRKDSQRCLSGLFTRADLPLFQLSALLRHPLLHELDPGILLSRGSPPAPETNGQSRSGL